MNFQLKNVKHAEFASEETNCYSAQLWADGKHVADVSNDGHGGCDMQYPTDREAFSAVIAYHAALPKTVHPARPEVGITEEWSSQPDVESTCNDLLTQWLIQKDVAKTLKRRICFIKPGEQAIYELPAKHKATKANVKKFAADRPTYTVLNLLPAAVAVTAFEKAGLIA